MFVGIAAVSIPVFWLGQVVGLLHPERSSTPVFRWLPGSGYVSFYPESRTVGAAPALPWLTLATLYAGIYARVLRAELVNALNEDYVRTARAKGLSERRILMRHALRCSLISIVSLFGLDFGALVGGAALLTEVVFGLPGVGS